MRPTLARRSGVGLGFCISHKHEMPPLPTLSVFWALDQCVSTLDTPDNHLGALKRLP